MDSRPSARSIVGFTSAENLSPLTRQASLHRFLGRRTLHPAVQPVFDLDSLRTKAHELLTRSFLAGAETPPKQLFLLAESHGLADALSRHLRRDGLARATECLGPGRLFLNTHPAELARPRAFVESVVAAARRYPELELTVEIHEEARLQPDSWVELRDSLCDKGISVAFDDFGAGRSRLLELSTAPPRYVKFSRSMVSQLHRRRRFDHKVLRPLVDFMRSIGSTPIAEGVETRAELQACRRAGFEWAQGFHLGRPRACGPTHFPSRSLLDDAIQEDAVR